MAAINNLLLFKKKILSLMLLRSILNRNRIRKIWVRQIFPERETKGDFHTVVIDKII